jgi:hypothetical protein
VPRPHEVRGHAGASQTEHRHTDDRFRHPEALRSTTAKDALRRRKDLRPSALASGATFEDATVRCERRSHVPTPQRRVAAGLRTGGWHTLGVGAGQIDWGSVPDWIAGVGSLAAIVVALWISLGEAKLRRRRDEDEEKRPARLVVLGEPALGSPQLGATEASE